MSRSLKLSLLVVISSAQVGCIEKADNAALDTSPTVQISGLLSSAGDGFSDSGDSSTPTVVLPCDGLLAVELLTPDDWAPKPPGGCGKTRLCGHSEVMAEKDGTQITGNAVRSPVLLRLLPPEVWAGDVTLTARLLRDDNTLYVGANQLPATSTRTITFEAPSDCGAEPQAPDVSSGGSSGNPDGASAGTGSG